MPRPPSSAGNRLETDWRELIVARDDVDLVDICTPGDTHAEIAIAALEAGKHVLCEKPLANTVDEAEKMVAAADAAASEFGTVAMVGFNYRRVPAIALARKLVAEGRIGQIRHVRAQYLQDWIVDPASPFTWRLDKAQGRLRCARRHRCAHHRPHPVHHRPQPDQGVRLHEPRLSTNARYPVRRRSGSGDR